MLPVKLNRVKEKDRRGLAFRFGSKKFPDPDGGDPIDTGFVSWEGEPVRETADERLESRRGVDGRKRESRGDVDKSAGDAILEMLTQAPEYQTLWTIIIDQLMSTGYARRLLERALKKLIEDEKVIVRSDPGAGKTAFECKLICLGAALRSGIPQR